MPISKKRIPRETELNRALSYIYDDINELINSVNNQEKALDSTKGKPGDLQVVKESKKHWSAKHKLNFKTEEGWEELVTSPENAKSFAKAGKQVILGYHPDEGTWEVADIGDTLEFQWGSPASVSLKPTAYTTQTIGSSTGVQLPTAITASSIAVGVTDGAKFTLQSQILTGDISYTCNSNTATFTVNKASNGLELPSGDAPGNISNRLYNENGVLKFNGTEVGSGGSGGSGEYSYKYIEVNGQDTVTATQDGDTLTLVGGSNVTIATDNTAESITFNATDTKATVTDVNNTTDYLNITTFNIQNAAISSSSTSVVDINTRVNYGTTAVSQYWDSNNEDLMPNIGDIYIQDTGDGVTNYPKLHVRISADRSANIKSTSTFWQKSSEPTPNPDPRCTSVYYTEVQNGSQYTTTYLPVGSILELYGKVTYQEISGTIDSGQPKVNFQTKYRNNVVYESQDINLGGSFDTVSVENHIIGIDAEEDNENAMLLRDGRTILSAVMTGCTETINGQSWPVDNNSSPDTIYWRNYKICGSSSGFPTSNDLNNPTAEILNSSNVYNTWINQRIVCPAAGRIWFAVPEGTPDITEIRVGSPSADNQIDGFGVEYIEYTNPEGMAENYKVWYTLGAQAPNTNDWYVS